MILLRIFSGDPKRPRHQPPSTRRGVLIPTPRLAAPCQPLLRAPHQRRRLPTVTSTLSPCQRKHPGRETVTGGTAALTGLRSPLRAATPTPRGSPAPCTPHPGPRQAYRAPRAPPQAPYFAERACADAHLLTLPFAHRQPGPPPVPQSVVRWPRASPFRLETQRPSLAIAARGHNEAALSGGFVICLGSGRGIRTPDLRVMSPTS